jgi:hypothetical protein
MGRSKLCPYYYIALEVFCQSYFFNIFAIDGKIPSVINYKLVTKETEISYQEIGIWNIEGWEVVD